MEGFDQRKLSKFLRALQLAKYLRNDNIPCQIQQGVFLGSIGAAFNKSVLQSLRITHILTIANAVDMPFKQDFKYKRIEILDSVDANLACHFEACFEFIEEAIATGGAVLVHCFAGKSRSVSAIVAYVMKSKRLRLREALELVKSHRPKASPNSGFMLQLEDFERHLGEGMN